MNVRIPDINPFTCNGNEMRREVRLFSLGYWRLISEPGLTSRKTRRHMSKCQCPASREERLLSPGAPFLHVAGIVT
jgi:hypothetical protein